MPDAIAHHRNCPQCGTAVAETLDGLCPRCVAALSLGGDTAFGEEDASLTSPPLSPEELSAHFPNLEIIECFGRGGMGVVYKARQKSLNRLVALKVLAPERVQDPQFAQRFTLEAHALASLNHPNIVTVHEFGQSDGLYFLIMEFVDGVSLRQAMKAGRFTPEQALAIVPPVCEALQYAHEIGIVHRDIKPENLLLDKQGRVKIADFGIARIMRGMPAAIGLEEPQIAGTPQYMAPEQKDRRTADHRADIYSLGVVLYELLTGELPPSDLRSPSAHIHGARFDARLDDVVLRALNDNPELRYQSAEGLKTHVETILTSPNSLETPISVSKSGRSAAATASTAPKASSPKKRGGLLVGGGVAALTAAAAFVIFGKHRPPEKALPAIADSVRFDSGSLADNFFVNVQNGTNPYSLAPGIGLGGAPGIKLHSADTSKDGTLVFRQKGFDLSTLNSLEASCYIRKQPFAANAGTDALAIGLLGSNSGFLGGGYADPSTADYAFVLLRLGVVDGKEWRLQTQSKASNTEGVVNPSNGAPFTAKDNAWYHLRATFKRVDATTIQVSGVVSNADANGTLGSVVRSLDPTNIPIPDIAGRHQVWVGLRGFGASGAGVWDRFSIAANGVSAGLPAAPDLTVKDLDAYRSALSWEDRSVNEDRFVVSRATKPGGPYADIATVAANTTSYIDGSANRTIPNYYQVRAVSAAGSSPSAEAALPAHVCPYRWENLAFGAGGSVTGISLHPTEPNLIYLRSNIGGFYRWDAGQERWIPITEQFTLADKDMYGGEGLALDPKNPDVVYIACGKYADSTRGPGSLFKSTDRGANWTRLPLEGVKMGSNEGRSGAGERLVVSPHDSNFLLFGSRNDGLWRSTDAGASWKKAAAFPGNGIALIGITSIAFDPQKNGVVYAALYGDGVYRSEDNGVSWARLEGSPGQVNQLAIQKSDTLFATHQAGVSCLANGAWTDVTPAKIAGPYCGICIHPADANDILVANDDIGATKIYRSKDGGQSWTKQSRTVTSDVPWHTSASREIPHIEGFKFDPKVPGRVWATDGYGVWRTDDIDAAPAAFRYEEKGLEQAVAFSLAAPATGAPLISGLASIDGFRHESLQEYPAAKLGLPGGYVQDTYSISVCESDPAHMVRTAGNRVNGFQVLTSADNGRTWTPTSWNSSFAKVLPLRVAMSSTDPANFVVITAKDIPQVTVDGGSTRRPVSGLPDGPSGPWNWIQPLAADKQAGGTFYYHDGFNIVYRSTDRGLNFLRVNDAVLDGQSWSAIKTLPGAKNDVWISHDRSGLYRSTDGGRSFTRIPSVRRAYLFAFGKPAPGGSTPALYLYGRINDSRDEIFRSLDLGATWLEATDSRVPAGGYPNVMEASAQTFGLVFIGTNGRGIYAGQPISETKPVATSAAAKP